MSDIKARITQIANLVSPNMTSKVQDPDQIPWNPDHEVFPTLDRLPKTSSAPKDAAWVWGKEDNLGRVNLLTPTRVKAAAAEIKTGEMVTLNLPVNEPDPPAFHRKAFVHTIKPLDPTAFDDEYSLNSQSSTQWDGFRHAGHPSGVFYNGVTADIIKSSLAMSTEGLHLGGTHHIAEHGIVARAILLDYHTWSQSHSSTHIDPFARDTVSLSSLLACAASQGVNLTPAATGGDVKPGDILLIRMGWTAKYRTVSQSEWTKYAQRDIREQFWAGIDGSSSELRAWIHDCYFTAVASDVPALEAWPPADPKECLHSTLLPLWGCLIGEFFDLERLSELCGQHSRWTVFFSSVLPNVKGGVGAWPNAMAIL